MCGRDLPQSHIYELSGYGNPRLNALNPAVFEQDDF